MKQVTILGVFAHPDDESFGPGGTLARCAAEGFDVHICTLTDGAAGTTTSDFEGCLSHGHELAQRRLEELECAVDTLGATLHYFGYHDSGMEGSDTNGRTDVLIHQPIDDVAGRLVHLIRQLEPDIILTHDETGGYFHPDHIYTFRATRMAFQMAGSPSQVSEPLAGDLKPFAPRAMYCHVIPKRNMRYVTGLLRLMGTDPARYGRNQDIDLTRIGRSDHDIQVRINIKSTLEVKRRAAACHSSQGGGSSLHLRKQAGLRDRLIFWFRQRSNRWEHFQQLYPEPDDHRQSFFEIGARDEREG